MSPDQWLDKYFSGEFFSGKFDHLKSIVTSLDINLGGSKVITVGGTNGKGHTCRILEKILLRSSKSVALWSSPHLLSVTERLSLNGTNIDSTRLVSELEKTKDLLSSFEKVSYFEFLFITFLRIVSLDHFDFIILEVGLGGRLDAANIINANTSIITSISRDHQELLGNSYREILNEKLGITRKERELISALELNYLRGCVQKAQRIKGFKWRDIFDLDPNTIKLHFVSRNILLAKESLRSYLLPSEINALCRDELESIAQRIPFLSRSASFHCYPSHNPDGLRKLVHFLSREKYNYSKCFVSFSKRNIGDIHLMVNLIRSYFGEEKVYLCDFEHNKALDFEAIERIGKKFNVTVVKAQQIKSFIEETEKQDILVTGSNYFISFFYNQFHS